jgi:ribosome-associated toxin RatA of RatAB toxin-antitoxin module
VDVTEITRSCLLLVPVEQAYRVVADVERYAEFLPACRSVSVLERRIDEHQVEWVEAQVTVGKAGAEYEFVTENQGVLNQRIEVQLKRGPFKRLHGLWSFKALGDEGCRIELRLEFEALGVLAGVLNPVAQKAADRMVDAFSQRISDGHDHGC